MMKFHNFTSLVCRMYQAGPALTPGPLLALLLVVLRTTSRSLSTLFKLRIWCTLRTSLAAFKGAVWRWGGGCTWGERHTEEWPLTREGRCGE
jgi:hypothetical protein